MSALLLHGVDRRLLSLHDRPAFSEAAERLSQSLFVVAAMRGEGVVVLNTCERYEVYCTQAGVAVDALGRTARLPADLSRLTGAAATRHLFRVAAGLESRIIGESHILGQVRSALEAAQLRGTVCRALDGAFAAALACGRRVRARVSFGAAAAGYAQRAVERLATFVELASSRVLVVGSGALAAELGAALRCRGVVHLTFAGRHEQRVSALAQRYHTRAMPLASLLDAASTFDAIVTAVSTAHPVLGLEAVRACRASCVVDLGSSPNVDPDVHALPGVRVVRLEDLEGSEVMANVLTRATAVVERELARYHTKPAAHRGTAHLRVAS